MLSFINKSLKRLAIILQVFWVFFPGILFLAIGYIFFTNFIQGKDILITGLRSRQTGLFFIIGLLFWALVTWYTSRLIAYNNDRLFHVAKEELYKTPRILGYACFTVIIIALATIYSGKNDIKLHAGVIICSVLVFLILHPLFETLKNKNDRSRLIKYRKIIWVFYAGIIACMVGINSIATYILFLPIIQIGYLFLVVTRRKISQTNKKHNKLIQYPNLDTLRNKYRNLLQWIFTDKERINDPLKNEIIAQTEKNIFFWFGLFSIVALTIYVLAIFSLPFSRYVTALPIILLSFGILLGAGNILSLFSNKQKINFHFLFIIALIIGGIFTEPHRVNLSRLENKDSPYSKRPDLKSHFTDWMQERRDALSDSTKKEYPIYFILADGGASRSAYWTASVLSRIDSETHGDFLNNIYCLSGASGGSLGNLAFLMAAKSKHKTSTTKEVQDYLSTDFLSFPLVRLMGPDILLPLLPIEVVKDRAEALENSLMNIPIENSVSSFIKKDFSTLIIADSLKNKMPVICINCTRMQDGSPAVVSNIQINNNVFGNRIDIVKLLDPGEGMSIATSIVLGARFPYFSPAGCIKNQYFVDGGYFDNSGAGVVHEMILELQKMVIDSLKINSNHYFGKLKFHVIHITNQPSEDLKIKKIHPLINDLAAPIKTILGSYTSQTDINNVRLYKYLLEIYKGDTTYRKINLYKKNESDSYPMNWSISDQSLNRMNKRLLNNNELDALIQQMKK